MEIMEMEWVRGDVIGHGSFASVNLAKPTKGSDRFPSTMAVKSCEDCRSTTLKNEKGVIDRVGSCPEIVRCFGDGYSVNNGERFYNLFLEYASRGSLADQVRKNGGGLRESDVRRYTRSVLKGLRHVHSKGFVHCDIKLQNVLVFDGGDVKIADFGLAKKSGNDEKPPQPQGEEGESSRWQCRGTPLYMSPESVNDNEYESPGDIWALGCAIVEMMTGKPAWNHCRNSNIFALLIRIGVGDELPMIPEELSEQGKDFLSKCFLKDPRKRWTAEMLLNHPFAAIDDSDQDRDHEETIPLKDCKSSSPFSPSSPFSFPDWVSSANCLSDRIRSLAGKWSPEWEDQDGWFTVR